MDEESLAHGFVTAIGPRHVGVPWLGNDDSYATLQRTHNKTTGYGYVYQGRYKRFPIENDDHFHAVCRYVERNALTANVVSRAEDYRWRVFGIGPVEIR